MSGRPFQQPVYYGISGAGLFGGTPVLSIMDNYPLGAVYLNIFENTGVVRATNGMPYLNRNYTIVAGNNPHGCGNMPMRFYIPQAQFYSFRVKQEDLDGKYSYSDPDGAAAGRGVSSAGDGG